MKNEEKAIEIAEDNIRVYKDSQYDYTFYAIRDACLEMANWKDEELKKDILELEAKNDVLKSCLRDKDSEIEILRHRIEAEKTYRMQIENALKSLPNSVKDLIRAFNMMF